MKEFLSKNKYKDHAIGVTAIQNDKLDGRETRTVQAYTNDLLGASSDSYTMIFSLILTHL